MAFLSRAIARLVPAVPKPVVGRIAARYIAGSSLDDAAHVVRRLNSEGKLATINLLGEEIATSEEAWAITRGHQDVLARVQADALDANISVKLSGLGLELDYGLCRGNVESLLRHGRRLDDRAHAAPLSRATQQRP